MEPAEYDGFELAMVKTEPDLGKKADVWVDDSIAQNVDGIYCIINP
jgi:hypothetical protein